eukprot:19856-Heterococcus_DN1.PRE.1
MIAGCELKSVWINVQASSAEMSRKLDPPQLVVLQRLGMEASMQECFKAYCELTPFVERCFTSWQQFAALHMCQALTFNQHNYEVLLQRHDATVKELLGQKQRAAELQEEVVVGASELSCAIDALGAAQAIVAELEQQHECNVSAAEAQIRLHRLQLEQRDQHWQALMQRELEKERAHVARLLEAHQREHDARAKAAAEAAAAAARKQCEDAVAAERERVRRAQAQQQEQDNAVQAAVNTAVLALQASEARSSLTVRPVSSERTPAIRPMTLLSMSGSGASNVSRVL